MEGERRISRMNIETRIARSEERHARREGMIRERERRGGREAKKGEEKAIKKVGGMEIYESEVKERV